MDELDEQQPAAKKSRTHSVGKPAVFLPSHAPVLRAVAASQFLTAPELGRLLLQTSKELTAAAYSRHDDIWKDVCMAHWGDKNATALLEAMKPTVLTAEQCFRRLVTDPASNYTATRPLRYTPSDYVVMITIREKNTYTNTNRQLLCKAIPGQEIAEFFDTGALEIGFDPFPWKRIVERVHFDDDGFPGMYSFYSSLYDLSLHSTVRILRLSDLKTVQLFDEKTGHHCLRALGKSGERKGILEHCPFPRDRNRDDSCCLLNATYAKFLFSSNHLLQYGIARPSLIFGLKPIFRLASYNSDNETTGQATIALSGCELSSYFADHHADRTSHGISNELKGKDVTFAHFLEALDIWFSP